VENRWVSLDTALGRSPDAQELMQMLGEQPVPAGR
jgi:hypothetical protein